MRHARLILKWEFVLEGACGVFEQNQAENPWVSGGSGRKFCSEAAKTSIFSIFPVNFNQMTSFFVLKHPRGGFQHTLTLRSWPTDAGNFKFDRTSIFGKSDFWARNP